MNASELLGAVGAASLRERLANASEGDGLARFMLDRLTGQQVAAVVQALLLDSETAQENQNRGATRPSGGLRPASGGDH